MALIRITAPTKRSVSAIEFKEFARMRASTAEDALIDSFIAAAEEYAENHMKRSIMAQQWRLTLDDIADEIELPRGPLSTVATAVSNFSYLDSSNATNAMPSTAYTVDTDAVNPVIHLTYDAEWPSDILNFRNSVNIEYWTGYADKNSVPANIKTWIKLKTAAWYENREAFTVGSGNFLTEMPRSHVDGLLDPEVVIKVS